MILMILPHIYSLLKLGYDLLFNKMIKKRQLSNFIEPSLACDDVNLYSDLPLLSL